MDKNLLDILPDEEIAKINRYIKNHIKAWDPDYTKLTPKEREELEKSELEMKNGDYITEEDFWK